MSHDENDWLFAMVCDEVELQIRHLGLEKPVDVLEKVIIPMTKEYDGFFMNEVFERVMEVFWNIKPKGLS